MLQDLSSIHEKPNDGLLASVRYEIPECRFMFYFLCFFGTTSATLTIYYYLC